MKDGGAAFPRVRTVLQVTNRDFRGLEEGNQTGMTLRDWFASTAPYEELVLPETREEAVEWLGVADEEYDADGWRRVVAKARYKHADAMLAEREKGSS